jgi:spermidine synthase
LQAVTWPIIGEAVPPDGDVLRLRRLGDDFRIEGNGLLMSSLLHGSEDVLATAACASIRDVAAPRVLVGGLGMGYTLRATLDALPAAAEVVVAELLPEIVAWNRGVLAHLARRPLDDPRATVEIVDVAVRIAQTRGGFDAILLDVDNGPGAFTQRSNAALYGELGLSDAYAALVPGGVFAVWSAYEDDRFARRLEGAGFAVDVRRVRGGAGRASPHHVIFLGWTSVD